MTTGADGSTVDVTDVLVSGQHTAASNGSPAEIAGTQSDAAAAIEPADPTSSDGARGLTPTPPPGTSVSPTRGDTASNASAPNAGVPAASGAREGPAVSPDKPDSPSTDEPTIGPPRWQDVTLAHIEREILFDRLPPDNGVVTPIASSLQEPGPELYDDLDTLAGALPNWPPGLVADPVQKVRNLLLVAAVTDVYQLPTEAYVPAIVFAQIEDVVPRETLIKILFWIAVHADEGDHSAVDQLQPLGLGNGPSDINEARGRAAVYAVKLLGRLTGKRPGG
jgi:hypothetical protein